MAELLKMDKSGRIVIPGRIRKKFPAGLFTVDVDDERIELRPVRSLPSLFGTVPGIDMKRLYEEHEEEVRDEQSAASR